MRTAIGWMKNNNTVIIFLLMLVVAAFASSSFFTERNLMNVLRQSSSVGILSVGMLFVVLTRGIDLSVGSIAALGAVVVALMAQTAHPGLALLIALLVGAGVGLASGRAAAFGHGPQRVTVSPSLSPGGIAVIGTIGR